ncbi:MAG: hypothetical protein JKX76_01275 [Colwellia sp.]|nr:hypothetical protein [Colwellia sp.]
MTQYFSIDDKVSGLWVEFTDLQSLVSDVIINSSKVIEYPSGQITTCIIEIDFSTSDSFEPFQSEINFSILLRIENEVQHATVITRDNTNYGMGMVVATPGTEPGVNNEGLDILTIKTFPFKSSANYVLRDQFVYETKR